MQSDDGTATNDDLIAALPTTVEELQALAVTQHQKVEQLTLFVEQLLEQIRLARHQHFGTRSERFTLEQMALAFNEAEAAIAAADDDQPLQEVGDTVVVPAHRRARGGRRRLPPTFPRVDIVHEIDAADCQCAQCCEPLEPVSEKVSEQLDIVPAQVRVLRHVRKTYACSSCNGAPKTAPLPAQPIPKSLASAGTLAHVAVAKYVDGLPLYRQEKKLQRIGVTLPRSTLAHWMVRAGELVQPLINLLRDRLLGYDIVSMDETRLQVLKEPGRRAQSQSYLWVQRGGPPAQPIVLYDYDPSRSQRVPMRLLDGFAGYLQTDGYEAYKRVCEVQGLIAVGCWAHVRRKFDEALKAQQLVSPEKRRHSLAASALKQIQALYRVERELKPLTPTARQRARQSRSVPLLDDFRGWLNNNLPLVPPQSALGKAMQYAHRQWGKLTVFVDDGRLRLDNGGFQGSCRLKIKITPPYCS